MWIFYTRSGGGDARGIFYQEVGAIQGFEIPIRILGILKNVPPPGGGLRNKCGFFTLEGVRGMAGVSSNKRCEQSKILKPLL